MAAPTSKTRRQVLKPDEKGRYRPRIVMLLAALGSGVWFWLSIEQDADECGITGMNGYEVAQRMRKEPVLENVVLVAMTGYCQE